MPALTQNRFNPAGYVTLLRVRRIHLDAAPVLYLRLNQLDEPAFFGIYDGFIQIWRVRNQKSFAPLGLLIVGHAPELSHRKRPVGIEQQRVQRGADH